MYAISPNFKIDPLTGKIFKTTTTAVEYVLNLDTKIEIYEDRVRGWFLDIGEKLKTDNEAGFVILMLATAYLESNQKFRDGDINEGGSGQRIKKALSRIFCGISDGAKDIIKKSVRNGLFHDAMTKESILLNASSKQVIIEKNGVLKINPHLFLDEIRKDFESHLSLLRNPKEMEGRAKFEKYWDFFHKTKYVRKVK